MVSPFRALRGARDGRALRRGTGRGSKGSPPEQCCSSWDSHRCSGAPSTHRHASPSLPPRTKPGMSRPAAPSTLPPSTAASTPQAPCPTHPVPLPHSYPSLQPGSHRLSCHPLRSALCSCVCPVVCPGAYPGFQCGVLPVGLLSCLLLSFPGKSAGPAAGGGRSGAAGTGRPCVPSCLSSALAALQFRPPTEKDSTDGARVELLWLQPQKTV